MPAWNALYQVRDFAYRIRSPKAAMFRFSGTRQRPASRIAPDRQADLANRPAGKRRLHSNDDSRVLVRYAIQWDDPGPFNSQLNDHHAFINFAEILMYVPDRRSEDTEVTFDDLPPDWKLISELPAGPRRKLLRGGKL